MNLVAVRGQSKNMTRLLVHVEGETEESFVNEVLAGHLYGFGYTKISARLVGNARQRDRRGGIRAWSSTRKDILRHLREDAGSLSASLAGPGRCGLATVSRKGTNYRGSTDGGYLHRDGRRL